MLKYCIVISFILSVFRPAPAYPQAVTVLAPNQPEIAIQAGNASNKSAKKNTRSLPADEIDMLIALQDPDENIGRDMDRPNLFASLYYAPDFEAGKGEPQLRNLLGDVEEIRYLDKRAWGANIDVSKPGLYQFILETKPRWDQAKNRFRQEQVKTILPVIAAGDGWNAPFGQSFEILPLTRPFGLIAPALFSAKVLLDGKPLVDIPVYVGRVNSEKRQFANNWQKIQEMRSDQAGQFSFILNQPGWWYCEAVIPGAPLKGPDGEMRELDRATIMWLYVNTPAVK